MKRSLSSRHRRFCLMPDSDPNCKVPACASSLGALEKARAYATKASSARKKTPIPCPLGREVLGLFSWSFLHTTAAHYPSSPTSEDKGAAVSLVSAVAQLYPCADCREDFQKSVTAAPPTPKVVESRENYAKYLCERHNEVNRKLGKQEFKCDPRLLDERWRKGGDGCEEGGLH